MLTEGERELQTPDLDISFFSLSPSFALSRVQSACSSDGDAPLGDRMISHYPNVASSHGNGGPKKPNLTFRFRKSVKVPMQPETKASHQQSSAHTPDLDIDRNTQFSPAFLFFFFAIRERTTPTEYGWHPLTLAFHGKPQSRDTSLGFVKKTHAPNNNILRCPAALSLKGRLDRFAFLTSFFFLHRRQKTERKTGRRRLLLLLLLLLSTAL